MKKITYTFILALSTILFSCGSDDDATPIVDTGGETVDDLILGKWQFVSESYDGVLEIFGECEMKSNVEFFDGGRFLHNEFWMEFNACTSDTWDAEWVSLDDGYYAVYEKGEEVEVEDDKFLPKFEDGLMIIEDEFEENGSMVKYKVVYKKIQ